MLKETPCKQNIYVYFVLISFQLRSIITVCLTEADINLRLYKHLSDRVPDHNDLEKGCAQSQLFYSFALQYAMRKIK